MELPDNITGWLSLIGFFVLGISLIYFQFKNQSVKLLREQVSDMKLRIEFLEAEVKSLCGERDTLAANFKDVKFKKNYLKQLVVESLASKTAINKKILQEVGAATKITNR